MTAVDAEKRRVSLSMKALPLLVVSDQLKAEATTTIFTSILPYYYPTYLLPYDC